MERLSQLIRGKRKEAGMTQKGLAEACGIGVSTVRRIESGEAVEPGWKDLCAIAQALNFHPFDISIAAGYISESDVHLESRLRGLDGMSAGELKCVQVHIDFLIQMREEQKEISGERDF